ncbi:hypothetical protein M0765_000505 [Variovorax sp. S2]|uniref:hypothetical protein n=1 Tax=Variovorax sp. S12S4 TaxID=3029170 RepID=UPI00215C5F39|nr:hypothetical protein [Variovorax sp. S12S4]MCR8956262.1 hypothetical protein [Variovorax sp. S12S4]
MANLYLSMTDALIKHWKANGNAYPKKFIITSAQHKAYVESRLMGIGGHNVDGSVHMDVPVEIAEGTPGVMVNGDGSEVSLQ